MERSSLLTENSECCSPKPIGLTIGFGKKRSCCPTESYEKDPFDEFIEKAIRMLRYQVWFSRTPGSGP